MQQTITPRGRTAGRAPDVERFNAASRARNARPRPSLIACAIALCAAPWMADPAAAQGRQQTVALQGQAAPGAGGAVFEFLHAPILNASGQVAFISALSGAGITQGVFRSDGGSVAAMVLQGQAAPGAGAGTFLNFDQLRLNGPGALSFYAAVAGGSSGGGYFGHAGGVTHHVALLGPAGFGGNIDGFRPQVLNDAGQVAFSITVSPFDPAVGREIIYRGIANALSPVADSGTVAPGSGGAQMRDLGDEVAMNGTGQVVFSSTLSTSGSALFRRDAAGNTTNRIVGTGDSAPGPAGGTFSDFSSPPALNDNGQTAFRANLAGGSSARGVFRSSGSSTVVAVALQGQLAPSSGDGLFDSFGLPRINNAGQTTFHATVSGGNAAAGLYRSDGSGLTALALQGQLAPGTGGGRFRTLSAAPQLNDAGVVLFDADIGGGTSSRGLFLSDGREILPIQLNGASLAGRPVGDVFVAGSQALNASGQVAYSVRFDDLRTGVFGYTPALRWRDSGGGSWDAATHWTLGLAPGAVHDVSIDPATTLMVSGPGGAASVRSLSVGSGTGFATLALAGGSITSASAVQIAERGILTGSGGIEAQVLNRGEVRADNLVITGGLINEGSVRGSSGGHHRIDASLSNRSAGVVRADAGELLLLQGNGHNNSGRIELRGGEVRLLASGSVNNFGVVEVRSGGDLLVHGASISNYGQVQVDRASARFAGGQAINVAGGRFTLDDGRVAFDGGLVNGGELRVTFGESQLSGSIVNEAGGKIILSGNSNTTFHDAVEVQAGAELRVSTGSSAVFFGPVLQRTGALFTGAGTKFYEGGLSVGASPGLGTDAGDVNFGAANVYLAEIGGLTAGTGFDKYIVAGHLGLGGTLRLAWWDGFQGQAGQTFDLFDWGSAGGSFDIIDFGAATLAPGLQWDTGQLYTTGEIGITAVPEPGAGVLLLAGLAVLGWRARRAAANEGDRA